SGRLVQGYEGLLQRPICVDRIAEALLNGVDSADGRGRGVPLKIRCRGGGFSCRVQHPLTKRWGCLCRCVYSHPCGHCTRRGIHQRSGVLAGDCLTDFTPTFFGLTSFFMFQSYFYLAENT
ncbi:unnamed protein product, partial [Ectocarpus sp. 13 AM-2016]